MEKKTMIIVGVAVVAIVVIIAAAFVLTQNGETKDKTAQEVANDFLKSYDGSFGEFTIEDGATDKVAKLSATVKTQLRDGTEAGKERVSHVEIYSYDTKDAAKVAFNDFIVHSKNGSKGKTLLDQTDKLGMADKSLKIYDLRETSAKQFGADNAYLFYAAFLSDSSAQYTMCTGALLDGKNVIVFNETINKDLYLNMAINESPADGEKAISVADYEKMLTNFCKAF